MKIAVFVNAGLGNALLQIPLLKKLKKQGTITGIFTSPYHCEELFDGSGIYDETISLYKNKTPLLWALENLKNFDSSYLDYFASTRKNLLIANAVSKRIVAAKPPKNIPPFLKKNMTYVKPVKNTHEAAQNLRLFDNSISDENIAETDFHLSYRAEPAHVSEIGASAIHAELIDLISPFVAVQISGGNNKTPYKNWPAKSWAKFFRLATTYNETLNFVLLGDKNEIKVAEEITDGNLPNVRSLVGQTNVKQAVEIVGKCKFYLGVDSGLMHLAVVHNKPTFTIWGGSDYNMYGYAKINPERHWIIQQKLDCWPCNSWLNPNTSRVSDPNKCPDFQCIKSISTEEVFEKFKAFAKKFNV
ncbi:MAG: hypothetical protein COA57_11000 [Flavobacteriales bacterium]|nr:MAG: hypothetical protein COA57_11000 [Flavobacteriales bacterium]